MFRIWCIGLALLGDNWVVVLFVFPANSHNRLEKSMEWESIALGASCITLSKALGCWELRPISSALRRSSLWESRL